MLHPTETHEVGLSKMSGHQPPSQQHREPTSNHFGASSTSSSPHLLKQLTSGSMMTVSSAKSSAQAHSTGQGAASTGTGSSSEDPPSCKKLKLDIGLAGTLGMGAPSAGSLNRSSVTSTAKSTRLRLLEKRKARRAKLLESYKDNMSEMFFLQSKGNVVDLPSFRKRPTQQYLNFLKSNSAPNDILDEVRFVKYSKYCNLHSPVKFHVTVHLGFVFCRNGA